MLLVLLCVFAGQCEVAAQGNGLAALRLLDLGAAEPGLRPLAMAMKGLGRSRESLCHLVAGKRRGPLCEVGPGQRRRSS